MMSLEAADSNMTCDERKRPAGDKWVFLKLDKREYSFPTISA